MSTLHYQPPFAPTSEIITQVASIAEQVGRLSAQTDYGMDLRNRIRSLSGPLALAGNSLTQAQVAALHDRMQAEAAAEAEAKAVRRRSRPSRPGGARIDP